MSAFARFRQRKAAIMLHTLMDLRRNISRCIRITEGKTHDVYLLDRLVLDPGAYHIMDRDTACFIVIKLMSKAKGSP